MYVRRNRCSAVMVKRDSGNQLGKRVDQDFRMAVRAQKRRERICFLGLAVAFFIAFFASFMIGRYPVDPPTLCKILLSSFLPLDQTWTQNASIVVWTIRLPRILAGILVGGCLSTAGLAFQSLFKNPMASPDILGASSGAGFGAALAILWGLGSGAVSASAFVFGLVAVGVAYLCSIRANHNPILGLILAGIMISSLFNAGISLIKLVADVDNTLPAITFWLMGSLSGKGMGDVAMGAIPMGIGLAVLLFMNPKLPLLSLGDDEAQSLGVNTKLSRLVIVIAATLVTSASVAIAGIVGWVGLVIPHFTRLLMGESKRYLMPGSLVMGATFLVVVDDIARAATTIDMPLGILTAFVGAPFFMYLIMRKGNASW